MFEAFAAPRNGDFSTAHFFRYRAASASGDTAAKILARFDDGNSWLMERGRRAGGKVLLWTSTLDEYWTDLPLQPVFLPFVQELARYAGRFSDSRAWYTAGEVLDLSRHGELTAMFQSKGARRWANRRLSRVWCLNLHRESAAVATANGAEHLAELHEQGFYELRGLATPVGRWTPRCGKRGYGGVGSVAL